MILACEVVVMCEMLVGKGKKLWWLWWRLVLPLNQPTPPNHATQTTHHRLLTCQHLLEAVHIGVQSGQRVP